LNVDGQVLLVHNRLRPRPYRPQGLGHRPETGLIQSSLVRPTTPQAAQGEDAFGVVAHSDVDAVPVDAGQGGGPVMGHDGSHGVGLREPLRSAQPRPSTRSRPP
jgi:hypothetical protein